MTLSTPDQALKAVGSEIRRTRLAQGRTLKTLAAEAGISHPFLSQLERGLARPSMATLDRIAAALGTTQVNLMLAAQTPASPAAGLGDIPDGVQVVRAHEGVVIPQTSEHEREGFSRLLISGTAAFYPQEQVISRAEFDNFYCHEQDEWVHVISGSIQIDLGGERTVELHAGDSLYYRGDIPHRWRATGDEPARLIVVQAAQATPAPSRD